MPKTPIYLQVRDDLAAKIEAGELRSEDRLPSERALAETLGVARMTVREALLLLLGEGQIYRKERQGYFVTPRRLRTDPTSHINVARLFEAAGRKPDAVLFEPVELVAGASLAQIMGCNGDAALYSTRSVTLMDGRRVCYEENYFRKEVLPGFLETPYYEPLTDFLKAEFGLQTVQTGFRARPTLLYGSVATALDVATGSPGLFIVRRKSHQGQVVQVDREFWLADVLDVVVGDFPGSG